MITYPCPNPRPGARPAGGILIEFETRSKFRLLWFRICSTDHNEVLCTLHCWNVCKISLWLAEYEQEQYKVISKSMEISLLGRVPGLDHFC